MVRHLLKISDLRREEIESIINAAIIIKEDRRKQNNAYEHLLLPRITLLLMFEKPSLRTRISFETAITQLGGTGIYYSLTESPLSKKKEDISDTGVVISGYTDIVLARVNSRKTNRKLAESCTVPIINALDDFAHPCQVIADLMTIREHKPKSKWNDLKLAYLGDTKGNVFYDLMRAAGVLGFSIVAAGPEDKEFEIEEEVLQECKEMCKVSGGKIKLLHDAREAVKDADIIYTDSWMSYGVPADHREERLEKLKPFQVTKELLQYPKPDHIFMNCLPAKRGMEQTADVIDGPTSVVYQEAENRLHTEKAILLFLMNRLHNIPRVYLAMHQPQQQKLIVALGGNALQRKGDKGSIEDQTRSARNACKILVDLVQNGYQLIITHGNGPQVGALHKQNTKSKNEVPPMPLDVEVAETQALIGYILQKELNNELRRRGLQRKVVTVVTQVVVDPNDPGFKKPTKPIGSYYSEDEAKKMQEEGYQVVEDSGKGWRIVVPSPNPLYVVEADVITQLVESGAIVIAAGGGGIPVVLDEGDTFKGVEAVIDKDLATSCLADNVRPECMLILTDVEYVYTNFRSKEEKKELKEVSVKQLKCLLESGEFAEGSMKPKVEAAIQFAHNRARLAIITSLEKAIEGMEGKAGTRVVPFLNVSSE